MQYHPDLYSQPKQENSGQILHPQPLMPNFCNLVQPMPVKTEAEVIDQQPSSVPFEQQLLDDNGEASHQSI